LKEIANPEYRETPQEQANSQRASAPVAKTRAAEQRSVPGLKRGTLSLLSFAIGLARLGRLSHCANFLELSRDKNVVWLETKQFPATIAYIWDRCGELTVEFSPDVSL
jgi:hypothetical protein